MLCKQTVSVRSPYRRMTSVTSGRGSVGYGPFLRYQAERIPLCDPIARAAVGRDPVCQVCEFLVYYRKGQEKDETDRLVAIRTLMFPRGSNPSS